MVKLGIMIVAIVFFCAIGYDEVESKKMSVSDIPKAFYPKLKKICDPEEMKKFIECIKGKIQNSKNVTPADVDAMADIFIKQKTCEKLPDPCDAEAFKKAMIKIAEENPEVVARLEKLTGDLGALLKCFPSVPSCKKKS